MYTAVFYARCKVNFYTFQLVPERSYRIVLKIVHFKTHINDLKFSIYSFVHSVRTIIKVRDPKTKSHLHIFFVDLDMSQNNKDIYNVQYLVNAKFVMSPLPPPANTRK